MKVLIYIGSYNTFQNSWNNFISHVKQKWTDDWITSEML